MDIQDFLDAGYRKFTQNNLKTYTNEFLQKRFDNSIGKKYFITVGIYDNRKYVDQFKVDPFSFEPESQFESNGVTFNITMLSSSSTTIKKIEDFFESTWQKMNCEYYEKFNEPIADTI